MYRQSCCQVSCLAALSCLLPLSGSLHAQPIPKPPLQTNGRVSINEPGLGEHVKLAPGSKWVVWFETGDGAGSDGLPGDADFNDAGAIIEFGQLVESLPARFMEVKNMKWAGGDDNDKILIVIGGGYSHQEKACAAYTFNATWGGQDPFENIPTIPQLYIHEYLSWDPIETHPERVAYSVTLQNRTTGAQMSTGTGGRTVPILPVRATAWVKRLDSGSGSGIASPTSITNFATGEHELAPGLIARAKATFTQSGCYHRDIDPGPMPTELCSTRLLLNGEPAPIMSVQQSELVFQVPFGTRTGAANLVLEVQGQRSPTKSVEVKSHSPGLLAYDMFTDIYEPGFGVFVQSGGGYVTGDSSVAPGDELGACAIGLGAVHPSVQDGDVPAFPTTTQTTPSLWIDNRLVSVKSAGLSPYCPLFYGTYLVSFVVPWDLDPGKHEVMLTVGGENSNTVNLTTGAHRAIQPRVTAITNSASYQRGAIAPGSWADLWGENLASDFKQLPTLSESILGTSLHVRDSQGRDHQMMLNLVGSDRVQFLLPEDVGVGPATLTVTNATGGSITTPVHVDRLVPGVFSANATGQGPAAATWLRVAEDGSRSSGFTFTVLPPPDRANIPIDLGSRDDIYLSFYGTGFRNNDIAFCTIGGVSVPVLAAVAQGQYPGLDQAVVGPIPASLRGAGDVDVNLQFNGLSTNPVTVNVR